jgi:hypothetical protein
MFSKFFVIVFFVVLLKNIIMNAIRQFIDLKNNTFQITLPENFNSKKIEVIILPVENDDNIPDWQKDIVLKRLEAIKQNPNLLIEEEQFWKEIDDEN